MGKLVSSQCVDFVKSFEGFSATPYYDEVGVKTLGYGMTGSEIEGLDYVTEEQATNMLGELLNNKYATPIKDNLDFKGVQLNQNQFDALVSMAYNIGVGGLLGSTLYKNICDGVRDVDTITANFTSWSKAGGQVLAGLLRRRQEEAAMFFSNGNKIEGEEKELKNIVGFNNQVDKRAAEYLADFLNCPTVDLVSTANAIDFSKVENVYFVGGGSFPALDNSKVIKGNDRFDTCIEVMKNIGKLK